MLTGICNSIFEYSALIGATLATLTKLRAPQLATTTSHGVPQSTQNLALPKRTVVSATPNHAVQE